MGEVEIHKVHFTVEGRFIVDLCRGVMTDGDENKAFRMLTESLEGMNARMANKILEGDATLTGSDNDIRLVEEEDIEYKKMLSEVRANIKRDENERMGEAEWREVALDCMDRLAELEPPDKAFVAEIKAKQARKRQIEAVKKPKERKRFFRDANDPVRRFLEMQDQDIEDFPAVALSKQEIANDSDYDKHFTWAISPTGKFYKVPFQRHDQWFRERYGQLDMEDYPGDDALPEMLCDVDRFPFMNFGWVMVSGGAGLGMTIHCNSNANRAALLEFIFMYAFNTFTVDVHDKRGFKMQIDYKEACRFINEQFGKDK